MYMNIDVGRLVRAPWNYKESDAVLAEKLKENIRKNGQVENLIVREIGAGAYEVVNGNHRLDALVELGVKEAMCYNLGKVSTAEAKRIAVETNETKFPNDPVKLSMLIASLTEEFDVKELALTMPYSDSELKELASLPSLDDTLPDLPEPPTPSYEETDLDTETESKRGVEKFSCPKCGFSFEVRK